MQKLLVRLFVKNSDNVTNIKVREQYGKMTSITGVCINLLLFATKFIVGTLSNSIAITSDAVNNLSDAGSSVISFISFKMSGKPADSQHPFGHARIEYIAASAVAFIILVIGVELFKSSVDKIIHPSEITFSWVTTAILVMSISLKLWLFSFYRSLSKRIDSSVLLATSADSLSDVMATSAVLIATFVSSLIHFQLDGYMGIVVTIFILMSGIQILQKTVDHMLGKGPSSELCEQIDSFIRKYDGVIGIHDLVVHDYGPNRNFASAHVEVDAKVDISISHDLIDVIERDISADYGIHLVIHLDPVIRDDPYVNQLHDLAEHVVTAIDGSLTIHDFRVVKGQIHSNLIFDINTPFQCKLTDDQIIHEIQDKIREIDKTLHTVVTIDRS